MKFSLRKLYRDRVLVLAGLDLAPTVENEPVLAFPTVGMHLADIADAALGAALIVATKVVCGDDAPVPRLAVIAMGKCGARELNYVSDVDVIFVGEQADAVTTRVAGELIRFATDAFFEVDAALRPEGKQGALVRTLESHVAYYERWAKTWEFQALLKARAAVGDAELGAQYIAALMPMVWLACEREDFVPEVQAMRPRVEELVPAGERGASSSWDGRLRDVELAVQLFQLVHGRNDERLHVASTVDALRARWPPSTSATTTPPTSPRRTSPPPARTPPAVAALEAQRTCCPRPTTRRSCAGWLGLRTSGPDGQHDALGVLREELKRLRASRVSRPACQALLPSRCSRRSVACPPGTSPRR